MKSPLQLPMRRRLIIGPLTLLLILGGAPVIAEQPAPSFVVPIDADGVQRAKVILDSYSYQPRHLIVDAGRAVELTLTSVTTITPHNFIIKDPAGGLVVEEDVRAGQTVVVKFMPIRSGMFEIYCDKRLWPFPSHRDKGMEGRLEVK